MEKYRMPSCRRALSVGAALGLAWALLAPLCLQAAELIIVFPANIPPWTMEREDRGIALDIMREALKPYGHTVIPSYYPLARFTYALHSHKNVDAVAMVEGGKIKESYYYYSEATGSFDTQLISLKSSKIAARKPEDLYRHSLIAFQDASRIYPGVDKIKRNNPRYTESSKQSSQVAMLFMERADLILVDKAIFQYWRHEVDIKRPHSGLHDIPQVDVSEALVQHDVKQLLGFEPASPMQTVFRSAEIRDQFNEGLRKLKQSGQYDKIMERE